MNKPAETEELVLTPPPPAVKLNRHIVIALAHMNKRRAALLKNRAVIDKELGEIDASILAIDK